MIDTTDIDKALDQLIDSLAELPIVCEEITADEQEIGVHCLTRAEAATAKNEHYPALVKLAKRAKCGVASITFTWKENGKPKQWVLPA